MGAAAYNRGNRLISRQFDDERRPVEFELMDRLNSLPKFDGARAPFNAIHFVAGNGGFWAECPVTGFGYWYRSLSEAVRSWRVSINQCNGTTYVAIPEGK